MPLLHNSPSFKASFITRLKSTICLLCFVSHVHCQITYDTTAISKEQVRNSSFVAYYLADSFSRAGDSIMASVFFQKVDPYYLIINSIKSESLNKEFEKFLLTAECKKRYREIFLKHYNGSNTEAFQKLMQMYIEDQEVRSKYSKSNDRLSDSIIERKLITTDSLHFKWLLNYVRTNGWPKYSDGGGYAAIIVLHDGRHFCDYLPYLRKSVLNGEADYKLHNEILRRCLSPSYESLLKKYKQKTVIDISFALKGKDPTEEQIKKLHDIIDQHKPVKYLVCVFESNNKDDYSAFIKSAKTWYNLESYWIAYRLMANLSTYQAEQLNTDDRAPFEFKYIESLKKNARLQLHILY